MYKYTFPGKKAEDITKEICTITVPETHVSHLLVHAGTNNLRTDSAKQCAQNIKNLVSCVKDKFPSAKIGISGLIMTYDIEVASKVQEVNKDLKQICINYDAHFVDNSNVNKSGLNNSKLHLNPKGSAVLAVQIIKFLRGDRHNSTSSQKQDFQKSAIRQMENLLRRLSRQPDRRQ